LGSAAVVVANSQWTKEQAQTVLRELGLDPHAERVRVVPLGTDPAQFRPGIDTREVKARHRLENGKWVVTVARLEPYKGIDTSLKAVAEVRKAGHDVGYLVIGAGKKKDAYKKLAQELGIAEAVRFVGSVPDKELPALYNVAEVYLGVSRRAEGTRVEGFGIALAEASACGLPVIAGRSGGVAEAVKDGETGFVVDPEDPAAAAQALMRLLSDQLLARRLGQAGRKAVETNYNWDRVVRDLREIESQVSS
ncbi:MAG TPA: glycosyltransferase family 4 protein, partial [Gemmatimonadales bacterium]|nr:glycosyltransferase family 4 protein [Gemmatimonadales bacterium]